MDRRVKERLVGASILVVLLVLIVPELLSGPKSSAPVSANAPASTPEPVRNVTVDLATSKTPTPDVVDPGEQAASSAPSSIASSADPVPPAAAPASAPVVTTLPAAAPAAAAAVPPLETSAPSPTSSSGHHAWAVQLGSFASRANADKLAHQLKGQGFSVYILAGGAGTSARYRVRIGPMSDRAAATSDVAKLKTLGHAASIVPPGP